MTEIEFLKARLDEGELFLTKGMRQYGHAAPLYWAGLGIKAALADIAAKRKIIEISEQWPLLAETEPEFSTETIGDDYVTSMSKQIAWITNQKYREAFGDEPPTTPVIRALIQPFSDHPDFQEDWRS